MTHNPPLIETILESYRVDEFTPAVTSQITLLDAFAATTLLGMVSNSENYYNMADQQSRDDAIDMAYKTAVSMINRRRYYLDRVTDSA